MNVLQGFLWRLKICLRTFEPKKTSQKNRNVLVRIVEQGGGKSNFFKEDLRQLYLIFLKFQ